LLPKILILLISILVKEKDMSLFSVINSTTSMGIKESARRRNINICIMLTVCHNPVGDDMLMAETAQAVTTPARAVACEAVIADSADSETLAP